MFWIILPSFIVLDLLWWRFADRRIRALPFSRSVRALLAACIVSMIAYLLLSMFFAGPVRRSGALPVVIHTFIYLWHFLALPIVTLILAAGSVVRGLRHRRKNARGAAPRPAPANAAPIAHPSGDAPFVIPEYAAPYIRPARSRSAPSRRQFLAAAAVAIPPLATGVASIGSVRDLYGRRLRSFTLTLPQLPRQLDGMTIAHVSDTHIGKFLNPERLPAIADDINKLDADFIAFTGDLIDLALDDLPHGVNFLRSLRSRCGMVVCEGNHDIMQNRGDFEYMMRDAELPILLGDHQMLPFVSRDGRSYPVQFLAVPWNMTEPEMADAVDILRPEVRPDAFPILLAHHPHTFDPAAAGHFPLVLSGHTHGGQIMLTSQIGVGSLRFRYTSGLYQKPGSSLIVNNGIGNWFPLRINAPAELVHITLRSSV